MLVVLMIETVDAVKNIEKAASGAPNAADWLTFLRDALEAVADAEATTPKGGSDAAIRRTTISQAKAQLRILEKA